jgi:hypothetical protein
MALRVLTFWPGQSWPISMSIPHPYQRRNTDTAGPRHGREYGSDLPGCQCDGKGGGDFAFPFRARHTRLWPFQILCLPAVVIAKDLMEFSPMAERERRRRSRQAQQFRPNPTCSDPAKSRSKLYWSKLLSSGLSRSQRPPIRIFGNYSFKRAQTRMRCAGRAGADR